MKKLERHVLDTIVRALEAPSAPGNAYDMDMRPIKVEDLVPGTPNHKLLDSDLYKAGYKHCFASFVSFLTLLDASKEDMIRFAGKPKKK